MRLMSNAAKSFDILRTSYIIIERPT